MRRASAAALFVAVAAPGAALAQATTFDVPAQSLSEGVLAVGRQAGVSVGIRDVAACNGQGGAVRGRMPVDTALARVLAGSGCVARRVDAQTYAVVRAPAPPPQPLRTAAPTLLAPAIPATETALLDSVVVSAARRDALVGRTPYAISTFSGADLAASGATSTQGVAAQFSGLIETNLGAGRDKLFIRGISDGAFTGRTQSTVGLYLDEVPITYSAPNPDLFLADVERVEVLRGPQGTLYGVGSVGGLMRIVTRRPDSAAWAAAVTASLSSTAHGSLSHAVSGMLNAPIVKDKVALRAVAYDEVMGGYLDNAGLGLTHVNRATRQGFRASAAATLATGWRLTAGYTLQSLNADDGQSTLASARTERGRALLEPHDNDFHQASATLEGRGGWGVLKLAAGYVRHDYSTRYDATPLSSLYAAPGAITAYDERNRVEFTVGEAVYSSPDDRRWQGLIGVFGAHAEQETQYAVTAGPLRAYDEARKDALHEAALFGETSYAITDRIKLTAGLRAFGAAMRTASTNRPTPGLVPGGRLRKTDVAPKIVLSFQVTPDRLLYVQAAEGYRLGGFNTSGLAGQALTGEVGLQPHRAYLADELWSYEAGGKAAFFGGRLQLQAAAFLAVWRDVQSDQFQASGLPYTANVGDAINRGVEAEASLRIDRRLTARANVVFNGPEITHQNPTFLGRDDASLPAVPNTSVVGSVDYRRPLRGGLDLTLHAQAEYIGRSRLSFGPVAGPAMGGYLTNRISAQVARRAWRAQVFVENIANAREDTFAFGNPFAGGQGYVTPLRPRTVGASIAADL